MSYFSSQTIENAYTRMQGNVKNRFWGLLAFSYSCNQIINSAIQYSVNLSQGANYLEHIFRFNDEEKITRSSSWYFILSNQWIVKGFELFFTQKISIFDIIIWCYRKENFVQDPDTRELLTKFINEFHFPQEAIEKWFIIDFNQEFVYEDHLASDIEILSKLNISNRKPFTLTTDTVNNQQVIAHACDISRAPFVQTLYSALSITECIIIAQFNLNSYYKINNMLTYGDKSLQQIFYGAPGTGKSHHVDSVTTMDNSIRTTFHPDSDYASFVGAYKPKMEKVGEKNFASDNYDLFELTNILSQLYAKSQDPNCNLTRPCQIFGAKYWKSLDKLEPKDLQKIVDTVYSTSDSKMKGEVDKGITVGKFLFEDLKKEQIVYKFVPQAFMQAYVKAWQWYIKDKNEEEKRSFYLVIEEINRGNCAQIFGDLFQLLDRSKNGYSSYAIVPDTDIQNYLEDEAFAELDISSFDSKITNDEGKEIATIEKIKNGSEMVLPPNLHIWATMNTSDQSLFPIDSAFKRRWDWKYMKIKDAGKNWKIGIIEKDNEQYDWWKFIGQINKIISNMTSSADKQLGYFFCKPDKKANENDVEPTIITAGTFVGKVLFYLWNDVFKDYAYENKALFTFKDENQIEQDLSFPDFYKDDDQVNEEVVKQFLDHVMDWKSDNSEDQQ